MSNFIPIVSNSPPPFADFEEDEDDFTDFTSANNKPWQEDSDGEEFGEFSTNWSNFSQKADDKIANDDNFNKSSKLKNNSVNDYTTSDIQPSSLSDKDNLYSTNNGFKDTSLDVTETVIESNNFFDNNDMKINGFSGYSTEPISNKDSENKDINLSTQNNKTVTSDFETPLTSEVPSDLNTVSPNNINELTNESDKNSDFTDSNDKQNSPPINFVESESNSDTISLENIESRAPQPEEQKNEMLLNEEISQVFETNSDIVKDNSSVESWSEATEQIEETNNFSETGSLQMQENLPNMDTNLGEIKVSGNNLQSEQSNNVQESAKNNLLKESGSENNDDNDVLSEADTSSLKSNTSETLNKSKEPPIELTVEESEKTFTNTIEQSDEFADFAVFGNFETDNSSPFNENQFQTFSESNQNVFETVNTSNTTNNSDKVDNKTFENNEFADFSAAPTYLDPSSINASENEDNDEFEAFQDAKEFPTTSSQNNLDNFASFDTGPPKNDFSEEDDDFGDFGDFGSFSNEANFVVSEKPAVVGKKLPLGEKMIKEIELSFFYENSDTTDSSKEISTVLQHIKKEILEIYECESTTQNPKKINRPSRLWSSMEDTDNTIALKFRWNNSHHNQQLLSALGAKTQNIYFSESSKPCYVPTYFSAGLRMSDSGIMQPMSAADIMTTVSPVDKSAPTQIPDQQWSSESDSSTTIDVEIHKSASNSSNGNNEGDVVAIENKASVLDFSGVDLAMLSYSSSPVPQEAQDKLDPELLELTMNITPDPVIQNKKTDPLSKILATLKNSSISKKKAEEEDADLSEEAKASLKKLPDLSYMSSSILMFPIGRQTSPN